MEQKNETVDEKKKKNSTGNTLWLELNSPSHLKMEQLLPGKSNGK